MKGLVKHLLASLGCLLALSPVLAHAQETDQWAHIRQTGVIRIANTQSSPPWSFLNDKNQPDGYDVDMAKALGKRLGVRVEFVADTYRNFVEGLKADKYDVVMNDLTPTPERMKQVDFSTPYGVEDFRIFVRQDNTDIHGAADLKGRSVGVSTGSSNESWARAHLPDSVIKSYDNGSLIFADLAVGRVDSVIISHFGGLKYASASHMPIKEVGPTLTYQLSAAAIAKNQPALLAAINKALAEMNQDGTTQTLGHKWVGADYDMVGSIAKAVAEEGASTPGK